MANVKACGGVLYWTTFSLSLAIAALSLVSKNGWLRYVYCLSLNSICILINCRIWSGAAVQGRPARNPLFYISIYAGVSDLLSAIVNFLHRLCVSQLNVVGHTHKMSICRRSYP